MACPKFIVSNQKEEFISIQRVIWTYVFSMTFQESTMTEVEIISVAEQVCTCKHKPGAQAFPGPKVKSKVFSLNKAHIVTEY